MIARQGDEEQPSQVRADQPFEAIGDGETLVAMGHQEVFSPDEGTVVNRGAHAIHIGTVRSPA